LKIWNCRCRMLLQQQQQQLQLHPRKAVVSAATILAARPLRFSRLVQLIKSLFLLPLQKLSPVLQTKFLLLLRRLRPPLHFIWIHLSLTLRPSKQVNDSISFGSM
jgi:hypothetical protein